MRERGRLLGGKVGESVDNCIYAVCYRRLIVDTNINKVIYMDYYTLSNSSNYRSISYLANL